MKLGLTKRSQVIRRFLLNGVKSSSPHLIQDAMEAFDISRQSVHAHLKDLIRLGYLTPEGNTKGRTYKLGINRHHSGIFQLSGLQEYDVYYRDFSSVFTDLPQEVEKIRSKFFQFNTEGVVINSITFFISDGKVPQEFISILSFELFTTLFTSLDKISLPSFDHKS